MKHRIGAVQVTFARTAVWCVAWKTMEVRKNVRPREASFKYFFFSKKIEKLKFFFVGGSLVFDFPCAKVHGKRKHTRQSKSFR